MDMIFPSRCLLRVAENLPLMLLVESGSTAPTSLPAGWWHQSSHQLEVPRWPTAGSPAREDQVRATRDLIGGGLRRSRGPLVGRTSPGTSSAATPFSGGSGLACPASVCRTFAPGVYLLPPHLHG